MPSSESAPNPPLLSHRFRTGGAYELVVFDRLPPGEQAVLAELRSDPELYGVLRPAAENGLTLKAVDRTTALLLLTLREPGPLPFFVLEAASEGTIEGIERLVLDSILEVEAGGAFVAGAAAGEALAVAAASANGAPPLPGAPPRPASRLAEISLAALRHGERADVDDPQELAALLYSYNREPLSPAWDGRLPDADGVLAFLGAAPGSPLARTLEAGWEQGERESSPGWIFFQPRRAEAAPQRGGFKLYVSPRTEALPRAFAAVAAALAPRGGVPFKVGCDAAGLLRPDKLVLYFRTVEELLAVARELEETLRALPAQGVPFSAPIDAAGLLSWGADPPASERLVSWQGPESWRQWVARRLAASLLAARAGVPSASTLPDAAAYALDRLRRDGVDVERWTPSAALWAA